ASSPRSQLPVTLPPGLAILLARPRATGFSGVITTIGTVLVAPWAAMAPDFEPANSTSGLSATSSPASGAMRSATPSPQRIPSVAAGPSTSPRSPGRDRPPAVSPVVGGGEGGDGTRTRGGPGVWCASPAGAHGGDPPPPPPMSLMKSRLL